ncbi:MAG: peptide chain release factor N(5)-glutamine methyltransferase [Candidatus Contendobacter sp.]|jgi:release factor glutamine methyltransferase|nr:peptide chain release factor N(5)-glutamine methyltransferase [Gammaproteobacteria bacterium]MCC8993862.1 peptide chain release factor N(5)-glutamine methyltransferase [Candidatus Contendobacter sp.]
MRNNRSLAELCATATQRLIGVSATPRLDAEVLLAAALNRPRSVLYAWPERIPEPELAERFAAWLERRLNGEPVAYLTGWREFWSLELEVTPDTLIPRPETELLVDLALERLPVDQSVAIADLGTGSGAIALALAVERPRARIVATDQSPAALTVARRNTERLQIANVEFRQGHWCAPLAGEFFDLIAANPPYVAAADPRWRQGELRFEPPAALISGPDGLDALRTIITQAPAVLKPGGWLLLEHGYDQGEAVPGLLRERGFSEVADHPDTAGLSRVGRGRWAG